MNIRNIVQLHRFCRTVFQTVRLGGCVLYAKHSSGANKLCFAYKTQPPSDRPVWKTGLPGGGFAALIALFFCCGPISSVHAQRIEVKSVILKLIERIEVPARQAGSLGEISVTEGQIVKEGSVLARIDDEEALLLKQKAELELQIAVMRSENDADVRSTAEEVVVLDQDLKRAEQSREKFPQSVPQSEFDHLRLKASQARFQLQRARHELDVAKSTRDLRATDLQFAKQNLERRKILSPLNGVVVEIYQQRGQWVDPGDKIMRIIRLDRLRAEGFVDIRETRESLVGRPVLLKVDLPGRENDEFPGRIVFVSPEIDPVNRQTRIWAEVENRDLLLQPGLRGQLVVGPVRSGPAKP